MSAVLNNITAPDEYSEASTAVALGSSEVMIAVNNQAIYWQRGFGAAGGAIGWTEAEEFLPPNSYVFETSCDAVRVRAAVKAAELPAPMKPAQVTVRLS